MNKKAMSLSIRLSLNLICVFVILAIISHQEEVVTRPTKFRLMEAPPIPFAFV